MWGLLFLLFFVFMITYDPKSGTLNRYIPIQNAECKNGHYQERQLAQPGDQCTKDGRSKMGVIVATYKQWL